MNDEDWKLWKQAEREVSHFAPEPKYRANESAVVWGLLAIGSAFIYRLAADIFGHESWLTMGSTGVAVGAFRYWEVRSAWKRHSSATKARYEELKRDA